MAEGQDVEVRAGAAVPMVAGALTADELVGRVDLVHEVSQRVMKDGIHFGPPFPGSKKKSLLKPGIEVLGLTFQLAPHFDYEQTDLPDGHREYRVLCRLIDTAGIIAGEGSGICSTMESKYRYRQGERVCPACRQPAIRKSSKGQDAGNWYCWAKIGGCGAKFDAADAAITHQEIGRVPNPDIADTYNTVLKMAEKRAHGGVILRTTGASELYTVEDGQLGSEPEDRPAGEPTPAAAPRDRLVTRPETDAFIAASGLSKDEATKLMKDTTKKARWGLVTTSELERLKVACALLADDAEPIPDAEVVDEAQPPLGEDAGPEQDF